MFYVGPSVGTITAVFFATFCHTTSGLAFPLQESIPSNKPIKLAQQSQHAQQQLNRRHSLVPILMSTIATTTTTAASSVLMPSHCNALTPNEASRQYDTYAASYDQLDGGKASSVLGIEEARRMLFQQAKGKVLEIGVGTGLNLQNYQCDQISSLTLVDISEGMLQETRARVDSLPLFRNIDVRLLKLDATSDLVATFGSEAFDTVVDSFSFCVFGKEGATRCLQQLSAVVKKEGQILLLENSRSSIPLLGLYQDVTADAAAQAGGKGCVYNQDVRSLIENSGKLSILAETNYAAGLFRAYQCVKS